MPQRSVIPPSAVDAACQSAGEDVLLAVHAQPGASREGPVEARSMPSRHGGPARAVIVWKVRAPAADGRANAALCRSVARAVGVAPAAVAIERGATSRAKTLRISGGTAAQVVAAIAGAPSGGGGHAGSA